MKLQNRFHSKLAISLVCSALFAGFVFPAGFARGAPRNIQQTDSSIRKCVAESGHLAAIFLIDESTSLKKSDPSNLRVAALKAAVAALSFNVGWKTSVGEEYRIEVAFAGFGKEYAKESRWFELSSNEDEELDKIVNSFANRNTQRGTNYLQGLVGAQEALRAKGERSPEVCKVLVWLSDGKLYIDGSENSKTSEAENDLCSNDGVADQLRSQKVFMVGFGLSDIEADEEIDFSLMQGITDGSIDCGLMPGFGIFQKVQSADELINNLFRNLSPYPPAIEKTRPCISEISNPECREVAFRTRPPLDQIRFLMSTSAGIDTAEVVEPSGASTTIIDESLPIAINGGVVSTDPLYDFASIVSLDLKTASMPHGEWIIRFRGKDADKAFVSAVFFSDVTAELVAGAPVVLNREDLQPIQIKMEEFGTDGLIAKSEGVSSTGFDSSPSISAELKFGSEVKSVQVLPVDPALGLFEIRLTETDIDGQPSLGTLSLEPVAVLSGHTIGFATSTFEVQLRLGDGMPSIVSASASDIKDENTSTVVLEIDGPKEGNGTVRVLDSVQITKFPTSDNQSRIQIFGAGELISIGQGEKQKIMLKLDPDFTANGRVAVKLEVELGNESGMPKSVPVEIEFSMSRPFDTGGFFKQVIPMVLGFLILQSILLALAGLRLARLTSRPSYTKFASGQIEFFADGSVSLNGGRISELGDKWVHLGSALKPSIAYSIGGIEYRQFPSDAIKSLFRPLHLQVHAKSNPGVLSEIAIGDRGFTVRDNEIWGLCRSSIEKSWVLVFDASSARSALANDQSLQGVFHCVYPDQDSEDSPYPIGLETEISMALIRDKVKNAISLVPQASGAQEAGEPSAGTGQGSGTGIGVPHEGIKTEYD
jgi:hypothetical protein